jgi:2-amino-4-hydroxy-6-hydroxymethyldihydropteridine diphosphokinase
MGLHRVYLSVGSNLGDPQLNCSRGIEALSNATGIFLLEQSPFYETQPVDYTDQDWFVNAALLIETPLSPNALLNTSQAIQNRFGRKEGGIRFGPRALDLDIIFYDQLVLHASHLTIPHPRMHKRRFVLQPICDIDPTVVHPVLGKNVQDILNQLVTDDQDIRKCSSGY